MKRYFKCKESNEKQNGKSFKSEHGGIDKVVIKIRTGKHNVICYYVSVITRNTEIKVKVAVSHNTYLRL